MWQTFQVIMEYLQETKRIIYEKDGVIVHIWNLEFYERIKHRPSMI